MDTMLSADDLNQNLPYVMVKAKLTRFLAHYNYIVAFHYAADSGDEFGVFNTNLIACMQVIENKQVDGYIEQDYPDEKEKTVRQNTVASDPGN